MSYPAQPRSGGPSRPYDPWYPYRRRRHPWRVRIARTLAVAGLFGLVVLIMVCALGAVFWSW